MLAEAPIPLSFDPIATGVAISLLVVPWVAGWISVRGKRLRLTASGFRAYPNSTRRGFELTFDGKLISTPYVVELRVKHYGRTKVEPKDFEGGLLSFSIGSFSDVVEIIEVKPPYWQDKVSITQDGKRVDFAPGLLKPGEEIQVLVLTDGSTYRSSWSPTNLSNVKTKERPLRSEELAHQIGWAKGSAVAWGLALFIFLVLPRLFS